MKKLLILFFLLLSALASDAQEYILGRSSNEIKSLMQESKYPLIKSEKAKAIGYDDFDCGSGIKMLCYYNIDGVCTIVRQLINVSNLNAMLKELNYSDIKINEKPNNWINLKKTMRIQLVTFKGKSKFALDYSLIP